MYKASLLTLCLLVYTPVIMAQGITPRRPAPSPARQQVSPATHVLSKEQLDRLRPIAQAILEKQRANEQSAIPIPDQYPVPSPSAVKLSIEVTPNLCLMGCTPPVVVQERAPIRRAPGPAEQLRNAIRVRNPIAIFIEEHSDFLHAVLEKERAQQSANALSDSGVAQNVGGLSMNLEGFNEGRGMLDGTLGEFNGSMEGFNERIEAATDGLIGAFKQLQQQVEAANQPPVPPPADNALPSSPTASAASHQSSTRLRVEAERVLVRANRNGFPIGNLLHGQHFVAKDVDKINHDVQGYAEGNVQKTGWVRFKDVFGEQEPPDHSDPRAPIITGRKAQLYLLNNYAFVYNGDDNQPSPATIKVPTLAYLNYDFKNRVPHDQLDRQLLPYDPNSNPRKFAWRYITDDGNYVMGRECQVDPAITGKPCLKGAPTNWVFVPICAVAIPGYSFPCP